MDRLAPYLADADPKVRRAAIATLTETVPEGAGAALVAALADEHGTVRRAAAAGLRELVEVLPATPAFGAALAERLTSADALVRATGLDVLRALRLGDRHTFGTGMDDPDRRVRIEAIRGLVSLDESDLVAAAAADPSREVGIRATKGLGIVGKPVPRAGAAGRRRRPAGPGRRPGGVGGRRRPAGGAGAARAAGLRLGGARRRGPLPGGRRPGDRGGTARRRARRRQPRRTQGGRARAHPLGGDPHAATALRTALADPDADVRAYARRALDDRTANTGAQGFS